MGREDTTCEGFVMNNQVQTSKRRSVTHARAPVKRASGRALGVAFL
jgi:hypothetical protein